MTGLKKDLRLHYKTIVQPAQFRFPIVKILRHELRSIPFSCQISDLEKKNLVFSN